ncbi:MAG: transporter [Opitutae bacterium]|nr:transporter [Opitutae bacterium]
MFFSRRSALLALATLLGFAGAALAQQPAPAPQPPAANIDQPQEHPTMFSRIRGLFDVDLPQIDPPGTFKVKLNPHFGDILRRRYLRLDTGLQWALNENLQLNVEADAFGTHGLRRGSATYGIGQVHLGTKYLFKEFLRPDFETSIGFNADLPTGRPPPDFTDGHNHYSPYFITQHHTEANPRLTTFAGVSMEFLTPSKAGGGFGVNQPRDDNFSLNAGAVYDLGQFKWTIAATYTSTALLGGKPEHFFTIRPSVLWFVPKRYTFNGKTQWIVGFGARSTWGPDGYEFSTGSRVRAELTFVQFVNRLRGRPDDAK